MELITKIKERFDKAAKLPDLWAQDLLFHRNELGELIYGLADSGADLNPVLEYLKDRHETAPDDMALAFDHICKLAKAIRKKAEISEDKEITLQLLTETGIVEGEIPKGKRAAFIFTGATDFGILRVYGDKPLPKYADSDTPRFTEKQFTPDYGLLVIAENAVKFTLSETISERRAVILALFD